MDQPLFEDENKIMNIIEFVQGASIQKAYSSGRFLCLACRIPGETIYFYLGRGGEYSGFWSSNQLHIKPFMRKKDYFLDYVRKHWVGLRVNKVTSNPEHRSFQFSMNKKGIEAELEIFYERNQFFFSFRLIRDEQLLYSFSNHPDSQELGRIHDIHTKDLGVKRKQYVKCLVAKEYHENIFKLFSRNKDIQKEIDTETYLYKRQFEKILSTSNKKRVRLIKAIETDLKFLSQVDIFLERIKAEPDLSRLSRSLEFNPLLKIKFKTDSHYKRLEEAYIKIKKYKAAITLQNERLSKVRALDNEGLEEKIHHNEYQQGLFLIGYIPIPWPKRSTSVHDVKNPKPSLDNNLVSKQNLYNILKFQDISCGVGLNSEGNVQLISQWAKDEDWWFHLEGQSSAYIVLKIKSLDISLISDCLKFLAPHLKLDVFVGREYDFIYTQVKHLGMIKGARGKVRYSQNKRLRIIF